MAENMSNKELEQKVKELEKEIAQYKLMYETQKEDWKRYKDIIEVCLDGIACTTLDGTIKEANKAFEEILGYSDEELKQLTYYDLTPKEWHDKEAEMFDIGLKDSYTPLYQKEYRRKDGTTIPVELRGYLAKDEEGKAAELWAFVRDITDRKQAEEELQESEKRYRKLFEHAGFGIVVFDPETKKRVEFNKVAYESMGYTREEFENTNMTRALDSKSPEEVEKRIDRIIKSRENLFETRHKTKNGEWRDFFVSAVPINIGGKVFIHNIRVDITDKKQAKDALQKAHDELEQRVAERTAELEAKNITLEEMNTSIRVLLKKREEDKSEMEDKMTLNLKELITPYLDKLKKCNLDHKERAYVSVLESNLNDIFSPLLRGLSSKQLKFTPQEIIIANHIRQGMNSKEIAEMMGLSRKTIESHRKNIRRKLGIQNRKENLRTHLMSIQ